jgi:phosphoribosyl 1,2-cyclic phosphodiesterase
VRVTLWGTRGSLPAAGPETVRYGGNTSCVEVRGADGTLLILDAGTGIRRLGAKLGPEISRLDLLLTHLHTDHIQGLGFFNPLYQPGLDVHIWGPASTTLDLRERLARYLSPPFFPALMRDMPSRITLHNVPCGRFEIGGFKVLADLVSHRGPTVGYRITEDAASIAYIPDHEPALGATDFPGDPDWTSGFELASGVDLLIHDAQYSDTEYEERVGWGHSSVRHALLFAAATGVRRLVTFHHDPAHDDSVLDRLVEEARGTSSLPFELVPGTEGATFQLGV